MGAQHIVFSVPEARFEAGGKSYGTFGEVESDFVSGALSEEALKGALVAAVNALLDPVRKHFAEDPEAKAILAQATPPSSPSPRARACVG